MAQAIRDKRVLHLIGEYLRRGAMVDGMVEASVEGTPQGGPLSPLLANIYLDALNQELERRGHRFCRYADGCNIYVGSQAAAERTLVSIRDWIEKHLRLEVNAAKSGTGKVWERKRRCGSCGAATGLAGGMASTAHPEMLLATVAQRRRAGAGAPAARASSQAAPHRAHEPGRVVQPKSGSRRTPKRPSPCSRDHLQHWRLSPGGVIGAAVGKRCRQTPNGAGCPLNCRIWVHGSNLDHERRAAESNAIQLRLPHASGSCRRIKRLGSTAGCGKPHVRWCGRVTGPQPPSLDPIIGTQPKDSGIFLPARIVS
jgi:hypothetical protein